MILAVHVVPDFGSPFEHMDISLPGFIQSHVSWPGAERPDGYSQATMFT